MVGEGGQWEGRSVLIKVECTCVMGAGVMGAGVMGAGVMGAGVREMKEGVCEGRRAGQVEGGCNIREYPGICMS